MVYSAVSAHSHGVIHKYLGAISRWVIKPALCALRRVGAPPSPRHAGQTRDFHGLSPPCIGLPYRSPMQPPTHSPIEAQASRVAWRGSDIVRTAGAICPFAPT